MEHTDVLVVGGGVIGLAFAASLESTGLLVTVIDQGSKPKLNSLVSKRKKNSVLVDINPRISALSISAWDFLNSFAEGLSGAPYQRMEVLDGEGTGKLTFCAKELGLGELGYIVENDHLSAELINNLERESNVRFHWNTELKELEQLEDGYAIKLANGILQTKLLVGADGSQSKVRKLADNNSFKWTYNQQGIVAIIETELPHGRTARQWFTSSGILAFLPLADKNLCSIVLSTKNYGEIMSMDEQALAYFLENLSERMLGKIVGVGPRLAFPILQEHSLRYVDENLAVIGDAAHTIHPLAGQGANIGFADAKDLSQLIKQSCLKGTSLGCREVLNQYQSSRRRDNFSTAALMEIFARGFSSSHPTVQWLRNEGMNFVDHSGSLKKIIAKLATLR